MNSDRLAVDVFDPCLEPFLRTPAGSVEEDSALGLLLEEVTPVIQGVIRGRVFGVITAVDRDEIVSEATLQLIKRLHELKADSDAAPIANFTGYAAVTAYNVIHTHMRRAYPDRQRLRNRVRHVLRESERWSVWRAESGQVLCGPAALAEGAAASDDVLDAVPALLTAPKGDWINITARVIGDVIEHVFRHVKNPVDLERLVEKVGELLRLPVLNRPSDTSERADASPSVESSLLYRSALREVWKEIETLPPKQRVALLLGLRDADGSGLLSLLVLLQIVSADGLASTLELTTSELGEIWDQLPLPDLAIAERLGLARQQVINLRKSARDRLGRRLSFLRDGNPLLQ